MWLALLADLGRPTVSAHPCGVCIDGGYAEAGSGVNDTRARACAVSSSYSSQSLPVALVSRRRMRTSRLMRTRQPCSATILLSEVLSVRPGNFFALKTVKGSDLTSRRCVTCASPGVDAREGLSALSSSCAFFNSSYKLKLSLYLPSCRTDRSGKMK